MVVDFYVTKPPTDNSNPPPSFARRTHEKCVRSSNILSDFGDDADECFSQATSMIFLYYASWQVLYGAGYDMSVGMTRAHVWASLSDGQGPF